MSRVLQQTDVDSVWWFEVTLPTGERLRACRIDGETTRVVIVECRTGAASYFGDGAVWIMFEHEETWVNLPGRLGFALTVERFLEIVPELTLLFERNRVST